MINTEPVDLQQKDIQFVVKEKPTRSEIEAIRNKWVIPSNPDKVCLITNYWAINERGYGPRLDCLENTDGPVISVGSSDRVLSLIASLKSPGGGILVELNPYFTEVSVPYYAEAILASEGNINRLNQFFIENDDLLFGLFDLAYETHSQKPPLQPQLQHSRYDSMEFLQKFRECRQQNQRYLGKHSWTQNSERLKKLYEIVKAGKLKGLTADITDPATWRVGIDALKKMGVQEPPNVIDISNIHRVQEWAQFGKGGKYTSLGTTLSQIFDSQKQEPVVLGSGIINSRKPYLVVGPYGNFSLKNQYKDDPVFGKYYGEDKYLLDRPPNTEGLPSAWISRGIWPLIKNTTKSL